MQYEQVFQGFKGYFLTQGFSRGKGQAYSPAPQLPLPPFPRLKSSVGKEIHSPKSTPHSQL